jgi:hypothetical protein
MSKRRFLVDGVTSALSGRVAPNNLPLMTSLERKRGPSSACERLSTGLDSLGACLSSVKAANHRVEARAASKWGRCEGRTGRTRHAAQPFTQFIELQATYNALKGVLNVREVSVLNVHVSARE